MHAISIYGWSDVKSLVSGRDDCPPDQLGEQLTCANDGPQPRQRLICHCGEPLFPDEIDSRWYHLWFHAYHGITPFGLPD